LLTLSLKHGRQMGKWGQWQFSIGFDQMPRVQQIAQPGSFSI